MLLLNELISDDIVMKVEECAMELYPNKLNMKRDDGNRRRD
jgi:hypothetical protein